MKLKWFEKKVDERQEMDLLKVEHFGFWLMYWMLLAALIIQGIFMEDGVKRAAGEWIIFMITSVVVVVGWVRKGVWNYQNRKVPGVKRYFGYSLITALAAGLPLGILSELKKGTNDIRGILISVCVYMAVMFIITFVVFLIVGSIAKKREADLADQDEEE